MEPYFSHSMLKWIKGLKKVEEQNLKGYGINGLLALRDARVDWDFLRACLKFWDTQAHVFRFGAALEEMCPTFEEFSAILGSRIDAALATPTIRVGYFHSFQAFLGLSRETADAMVCGNNVNLASLIAEFIEEDFDDLVRQRFRMKALVFCLVSGCLFLEEPGWGHISLIELVSEMSDYRSIAGMVLAETLLSLDRAYRVQGRWSVSPIVLQVWLRDHLQIVRPPLTLPYNVKSYKSRGILVRQNSERDWISWLLELGPDEILWFVPWYGIESFITMSYGYRMVYLLGLTYTTFYQGTRILRQMGHTQSIPPDGPVFESAPINAKVQKAILGGWARAFHSVRPAGRSDYLDEYQAWLIATVWADEKAKRVALIKEIESEILESTGGSDEDSDDVHPKRRRHH